jgi:hypothetical protein
MAHRAGDKDQKNSRSEQGGRDRQEMRQARTDAHSRADALRRVGVHDDDPPIAGFGTQPSV